VHEAWKGNTDLAKAVLHSAKGRLDPSGLLELQIYVFHLAEHNPSEALPLIDSMVSESVSGWDAVYPKAFLYALAHEALGDAARARQEYQTALPLLQAEAELTKKSRNANQFIVLARTYAGLGRKEDALRETRRAVELLPISKDALDGPEVELGRALVEARVGETEAAIEHVRQLLSIPSQLSPALLRIDPGWAPLRNDPRFRKLAELEQE
jgi:tetratricopeptide (TPR) repeat protein